MRCILWETLAWCLSEWKAATAMSCPGGGLPFSDSRRRRETGARRNHDWCSRKKAHFRLHTTGQLTLSAWTVK